MTRIEAVQRAAAYLRGAGWTVEAFDFRMGRKVLPLVVRRGNDVAFVEATAGGVGPLSPARRRAIETVAALWVLRFGRVADRYRVDTVRIQSGLGGCHLVEYVAGSAAQ